MPLRAYNQMPLGKIENGKMILNEYGKIVYEEWIKSTMIRKEIKNHEFVVMPNHFHAIVEIKKTEVNNEPVGAYGIRPKDNENIHTISDEQQGVCHTPLQFSLQSPSKTVGALVRGFKSSVTKQLGYPVWQRDYFDHIIRNEQSYQKIAEYITNNPTNWENDKFYTE